MVAPGRRGGRFLKIWRDAGARAILVGKSLKWLAARQTQGGNNG
jgi:hypothetical protein